MSGRTVGVAIALTLLLVAVGSAAAHDRTYRPVVFGTAVQAGELGTTGAHAGGSLSTVPPNATWTSPGPCAIPGGQMPQTPATGCNQVDLELGPGLVTDLALADEPIPLTFHLSSDYLLVPGAVPVGDAGAAPMVTVTATLLNDGEPVGSASQTQDVITGPDGVPTPFEFELEPETRNLTAGDLTLEVAWYQVQEDWGQGMWNIHNGEEYGTQFILPVDGNPYQAEVEVEPIVGLCSGPMDTGVEVSVEGGPGGGSVEVSAPGGDVGPLCSGGVPDDARLIRATIVSPFGPKGIDTESIEIELDDPNAQLSSPLTSTSDDAVTALWMWQDPPEDAGAVEATLHVENHQGTLGLGSIEGTATGHNTFTLDLPASAGAQVPGFTPLAVLAGLGVALLVMRKRLQ